MSNQQHVQTSLVFGALAPKLHEQLPLSRRQLRYLQECADCITTLAIGRLLSEAETHRARRRLIQRIQQTFFMARKKGRTA